MSAYTCVTQKTHTLKNIKYYSFFFRGINGFLTLFCQNSSYPLGGRGPEAGRVTEKSKEIVNAAAKI